MNINEEEGFLMMKVGEISYYSHRDGYSVNATYDNIGAKDYSRSREDQLIWENTERDEEDIIPIGEVTDCETFGDNNQIESIEQMEDLVFGHLADNNLWDRFHEDIEILDIGRDELCEELEYNMEFRERKIMAMYSSVYDLGQSAEIEDTQGNTFETSLRSDNFGEIVG